MSQYRSVKEVASYVKDQFKIEMDISDVIRNCAEALRLLGVFATGRELMFTTVKDFCVKTSGVKKIMSVTRLDNTIFSTIKVELQDIYFPPQIVFQMPEEEADETGTIKYKDNYIPAPKGPWIDFVWDCPHVRFNETDLDVAIETISIRKDKEGYPEIPDGAFYACAYYCAFSFQMPLFLLGKVPPVVFGKLEEMKERKFGQARAQLFIDDYSRNEADNLMNIMASMDRKGYNTPV